MSTEVTLFKLLHFRSKDISWFKDKLEDQLKKHSQWTSPLIQTEILELAGYLVLEEISDEARESKEIGIIVDETSDISRIEQVSVCLRFLIDGVTKEVFVGFDNTKCTEGLALYELINSFATKRVVNDPAGIYRDFLFNMRDKTGFWILTSFKLCST